MITNSMSYTASFFTASYSIDEYGQEIKGEDILYEDVKCKIRASKKRSGSISTETGSEEVFSEGWKVIVPFQYDMAKVGDLVEFGGVKYTIAKKFERLGGKVSQEIIYFVE